MSDDGDSGAERASRASDVPAQLVEEREVVVRSFLKKGVEYTELLLHENQDLRDEIAALRKENAGLLAQIASDDAIRDLLRTVEKLERERRDLTTRSHELEASRKAYEGRAEEIEQEVNDLANLYIASYQLHASLSVRRVVRQLRDMIGQLVGALGFAIYIIDPDGKMAHPIASEKLEESDIVPVIVGEGPVGEPCLTGIARIREDDHRAFNVGSHDDPIAVIPLMADGRPIGVVSVVTLLEQKHRWVSVDRELFQLIGAQAGAALIAANLYSTADGPTQALAGLKDRL